MQQRLFAKIILFALFAQILSPYSFVLDFKKGMQFSKNSASALVGSGHPGGVSTGALMWFTAGSGVTSGTSVTSWQNNTMNGFGGYNIFNQISGNPTLEENTLNFNPVIDFDGDDSIRSGIQAAPSLVGEDDNTSFIVKITSNAGVEAGFRGGNSYPDLRAGYFEIDGTKQRFDTGRPDQALIGNEDVLNKPVIAAGIATTSTATNSRVISINGGIDVTASTANKGDDNADGEFSFGSQPVADTVFATTKIAEYINYGLQLSYSDIQKVESYLALKYGLTLELPETILAEVTGSTGLALGYSGLGQTFTSTEDGNISEVSFRTGNAGTASTINVFVCEATFANGNNCNATNGIQIASNIAYTQNTTYTLPVTGFPMTNGNTYAFYVVQSSGGSEISLSENNVDEYPGHTGYGNLGSYPKDFVFSVKYITNTYLNSSGQSMFDSLSEETYHNNIFGIARDDTGALDQRVSKSQESGAILTLATDDDFTSANDMSRTSLSDGQYLVVGTDAGTITENLASSELPTTATSRIDREWRVDNTGNVGAIHLKFDGFNSDWALYSDSDGDFSDGVFIGELSANGTIQTTLSDDIYFTLAKPVAITPGGINTSDLLGWWDAGQDTYSDAGVMLAQSGTTVQQINDQIGGVHLSQTNAVRKPTYLENGVNFNPALDFDGVDDFVAGGTSVLRTVNPSVHVSSLLDIDSRITTSHPVTDGNGSVSNTTYALTLNPTTTTTTFINNFSQGSVVSVADTQTGSVLLRSEWDNFVDGGVSQYRNGRLEAQNSNAQNNFQNVGTQWSLGARYGGGLPFDGKIPEVVISDNDRYGTVSIPRIQSYFAIKYGLTLDQTTATDYRISDNTIVWDSSENTGYKDHIVAIGQDFFGNIHQRISKSQEDGAILILTSDEVIEDFTSPNNTLRASIDDKSFVVLSSNGLIASSTGAELVPGYTDRLEREWKASITGTPGFVNVKFDSVEISGNEWDLVQSDTPDFTDAGANILKVADLNTNGEALDVTFVDGKYYTLMNIGVSVEFTTSTGSSLENVGGNLPSIILSGALASPAEVLLSFSGTAITGIDYSVTEPYSLTIPVGTYSGQTLPITGITIIDDFIPEDDETIILTLSTSGSLSVGDVNSLDGVISEFTYTINDNDTSKVVINELEYDSVQSSPDEVYEWIELKNIGTGSIDISGWTIEDNDNQNYIIPANTLITSGSILLIANFDPNPNDDDGFRTNYPSINPNLDAGQVLNFSNAGDPITLKDTSGNIIDFVAYENADPLWNTLSAGANAGESLCRKRNLLNGLTLDTDTVIDWQVCTTPSPQTENIFDIEAPVITLVGSGIIDIEAGTTFSDLGATWTDNIDGTGSISVATSGGPVTTSATGSFTLGYTYTDLAGNTGTGVTRIVNVVDTTSPVISLVGSGIVNVEVGDTYSELGATWTDNLDGSGSISSPISGGPVITTNTGSFTLSYNYTDISGNTGSIVSRTVNVIDTTPPVIPTIGVPTNFNPLTGTGEIGALIGVYNSGGILVGTGIVDGSGNFSITPNSIPTTGPVDVTSTDSSGNTSTGTILAISIDTIKPVISLIGSGTVSILLNASYTDSGATASDSLDGDITADIVSSGSVNTAVTGNYQIDYNVSDTAGNIADTVSRVVNVVDSYVQTGTTSASVTDTGATVSWTTLTPTSTQVLYGLTTQTNNSTNQTDISPKVLSHSVTLTGLLACTQYYFKTLSTDTNNNTFTGSILSFTTTGCAGGASITDSEDYPVIPTGSGATGTEVLTLGTGSTKTEISVPVGYFDSGTGSCAGNGAYFQIKELSSSEVTSSLGVPSTNPNTLKAYDFGAYCTPDEQVTSFDSQLTISVSYTNSQVRGLNESELKIYRYNTSTSSWEVLSSCSVDTLNNIVSCRTDKFSTFGVFGTSVATGGTGSSRRDYCPNGDISGSRYDNICEKEDEIVVVTPEVSDEEDTNEGEELPLADENDDTIVKDENIENENRNTQDADTENPESVTKRYTDNEGNTIDYTLTNTFESCSTVDYMNVPRDNYENLGFTDIADSKYREVIESFQGVGVISGLNDGSFEPLRETTRVEFLKIVFKAHCIDYRVSENDGSNLDFMDLDYTSWYISAIAEAYSRGIINGDIDENGNKVFRPNDVITKAEALKILINMGGILPVEGDSTPYSDVTTLWHIPYVRTAHSLGMLEGFEDANLSPNEGVLRENMMNLLDRVLKLYR